MKKVLILFILLLTFPILTNAATNANNLKELREELAAYKAKKAAADSSKNKTQSEINSSKNAISKAQNEIETNKAKIEQAKIEIQELNIEIDKTKNKINQIMKANEISSKDKSYLEYIFSAKSISDLIVRMNASRQIADYNDGLVTGYEEKITENENLQRDLANREVELNKTIDNLEVAIDSLGSRLSSFIEEALDAQSDIDSTQKLINYYVGLGCKETENFNDCVRVKGDTGFIKPLKKGTITSHFGYRTNPITGQKNKFHSGTDIGGNPEGTPVYSAANGMVGKIINRASCGGNQIYIYHTINGVKYTTGYNHLLTINVKVGDIVTNQTVIGTVGGGKGTSSYERCSTGPHLHFMIGKGWYGSTYVSYNTWVTNLLNPINIIKFPAKGVFFYSRF